MGVDGKAATHIPQIPSPASSHRENLIFMDHQTKKTAKYYGSEFCGNNTCSRKRGYFGLTTFCPWPGSASSPSHRLLPLGIRMDQGEVAQRRASGSDITFSKDDPAAPVAAVGVGTRHGHSQKLPVVEGTWG